MTLFCVYLWIFSFSDHLFYRAVLGNCLFHVQVAKFQPPDTINSIKQVFFMHSVLQEVAIKRRSLTWHPWKLSVKELIYNEVARCQPTS